MEQSKINYKTLSKKNAVTDKEKRLLAIKQEIDRNILVDDYYTAEELRKVWEDINASI